MSSAVIPAVTSLANSPSATPRRVRKVVFDGIGLFSKADKAEFLAKYAPEIAPDEYGRQFVWAWHFVRDQMLYFPYFRKTPACARNQPMASPERLHRTVVEVLKALTTYHKGYRASFRHDDRARLPLITHPTFCMASEDDPLSAGVAEAAVLVKNSRHAILSSERVPGGAATKAAAIAAFLDA